MKFFDIILTEGRVEDFKSKYSQRFSKEELDEIASNFMPKYLDWAGKNINRQNFNEDISKVKQLLQRFDIISSNLPKTDISQYGSTEELYNAIIEYDNRQRRNIEKIHGANVVYEDDNYLVVNPLDNNSSCYYGKGTKWCTSSSGNAQFTTYNEDGKLFYILSKKLPTDNPFYKIALLKKYNGDESYWDAQDTKITNNEFLNNENIIKIKNAIANYLKTEFAEQIKIFSHVESAKKEKERLERIRQQRIREERLEEANERRLDGEWELGPNCPEDGLEAHALLIYLKDQQEIDILTNEDKVRISEIEQEIERLNNQYDSNEDVELNLLDQISELEDELEEIKNKIDVYNIIPTGEFYNLTEFVVISENVEGNRYAVGNQDDMDKTAYNYVDNLIDDIGYDGFSESFLESNIDEESVAYHARDSYSYDLSENPESYFEDEDRMLSPQQEDRINIIKNRIERIQQSISKIEEYINLTDDEEYIDESNEKIDELDNNIAELEEEIEEMESSPEGDFPDELIDDKLNEMVSHAKRNPKEYLNEYELNYEDFIDKDNFIQEVIDADGYGMVNSYDGDVEEIYVQKEIFYVMRID